MFGAFYEQYNRINNVFEATRIMIEADDKFQDPLKTQLNSLIEKFTYWTLLVPVLVLFLFAWLAMMIPNQTADDTSPPLNDRSRE
jgi:hypothetical protein